MNKQKTKSRTPKSDHSFRIITFNLLSPSYATHECYPHSSPDHLDASFRFKKITDLLTKWIKANFIICLQEVSDEWNVELKKLFESLRYDYISNLYSGGIMGVAIAYPLAHFKLLDTDIYRCGENVENVMKYMSSPDQDILEIPKIESILTDLIAAGESTNIALTVLLKCMYFGKDTKKNLIVTTYHMPCKYTKKHFMASHIHSLKSRVNALQQLWSQQYHDEGSNNSVVITGDFNITPKSPEYKYLLGESDELELLNSNESFQFYNDLKKIYNKAQQDFQSSLQLSSVHFKHNKKEPLYTNVALQKDRKFIDCLDYIFVNNKVNIMSCLVGLTSMTQKVGSYPNAWCPSDHLPLSASLSI